ncbi:helix-turn-helix transcriptional regulator [Rhodoferax sp. AJA081-3]|uniref:helix-turn-helix domain-containing protein n=1 Tax=Rhodoferax sp. AJA081-3 TaxID=2752316 RepID=UPI001ADF029E|nr:helix-turn-helix transcriptional regulator [Rhodoferax sp. AJA081-3]QTN26222.1 helix-turn-helix transcriptional regulator [Rhodoferax sp. AJA081-3]
MRPSKNQPLISALATEIKLRRQELGFTQEDLAGICQLDRPYISLIEVGSKQPTISVLLRLAEGLQYPLGDFMGRVEQRYQVEQSVADSGIKPARTRSMKSS